MRREHWHLTLRFFGALRAEAVSGLVSVLDAIGGQTRPIRVAFGTPIALPSWRAARVVAFRLESDGALEALARRLDDALAAAFGAPDKPFLPHVTVLRLRHPAPRRIRAAEAAFTALGVPRAAPCTCAELTLYSSELTREGPRYTALGSFPFLSADLSGDPCGSGETRS